MTLLTVVLLAALTITSNRQATNVAKSMSSAGVVDSMRRAAASRDARTLEAFWSRRAMTGPAIEPHPTASDSLIVTFFYRGSGHEQDVTLNCNAGYVLLHEQPMFYSGGPAGRFQRVDATDVWYLTMPAPSDLVTAYTIDVVDTAGHERSLADPLNPDSIWSGNGSMVSALVLPDAPDEDWVSPRDTPSSSWRVDSVRTNRGSGARRIWVHLPDGFNPDRPEAYPLVMALNRYNFHDAIPTSAIVDRLIERGAIPPVVLVIADELDPGPDGYDSSVAWIAEELVPSVRKRYHTSARASDVVLVGASRRGLVAATVGLLRPDAVGNVLSLSGAFYWRPSPADRYEWLTAQYARRARVPVRFYLAVGRLETVLTRGNSGHYPLATSRHFADVLRARGYDSILEEFSGTHDELNWRGWFARGLRHLLGPPAHDRRKDQPH